MHLIEEREGKPIFQEGQGNGSFISNELQESSAYWLIDAGVVQWVVSRCFRKERTVQEGATPELDGCEHAVGGAPKRLEDEESGRSGREGNCHSSLRPFQGENTAPMLRAEESSLGVAGYAAAAAVSSPIIAPALLRRLSSSYETHCLTGFRTHCNPP